VSRALRPAALVAALTLVAAPALASAKPLSVAKPANAPAVAASATAAYAQTRPVGNLASGEQIRGMVLNPPKSDPSKRTPDFQRMKADGINTLSIYITWEIHNAFSSDLHATKDTPSDKSLKTITSLAHEQGFAVEWMPIVSSAGGAPRYNILPNNMSDWWTKYTAMIDRYAAFAHTMGVEVFSIGSELGALQKYTQQWLTIIDHVRHKDQYTGLTTYMSTTGAGFVDLGWWGNVDLLSVSPYWSLSPAKVPAVDNLVAAWKNQYLPELKTLWTTNNKPVLMDEIGYPNQDFAAYRPAVAWQNHTAHPNEQSQANAYEALLRVSGESAQQPWLKGVVWFYWGAPRTPSTHPDTSYNPRDHKAECVIAAYWAARTVPKGELVSSNPPGCVVAHTA
jgi:hypothetical protein